MRTGTPAVSPGLCMLRPGSQGRWSDNFVSPLGTERGGMGTEKAVQHSSSTSIQVENTISFLRPGAIVEATELVETW